MRARSASTARRAGATGWRSCASSVDDRRRRVVAARIDGAVVSAAGAGTDGGRGIDLDGAGAAQLAREQAAAHDGAADVLDHRARGVDGTLEDLRAEGDQLIAADEQAERGGLRRRAQPDAADGADVAAEV